MSNIDYENRNTAFIKGFNNTKTYINFVLLQKKGMPTDKLIAEIVSILKLQGIDKLILFGSYSQGNPTAESDIDLLAIKNIPENKIRDFRIKFKKALWSKLGSENKEFDVLVDSEDRIKQRIAMGDLFYNEIFNNGKVLYAK